MLRQVTLNVKHSNNALRVRREDLRESSPDTDPNDDDVQHRAELEAKLRESLAGAFSFDVFDEQTASSTVPSTTKPVTSTKAAEKKTDTVENNDTREEGADTEEPEEFEFRLFRSAPATKVVLPDADEDEIQGDGAMARRRPMSYYISPSLSVEQREAIAFAALSGEQVLERAKQRLWGMEMPWRVTHLGIAPKSLRTGTGAETLSGSTKKIGDGEDEKTRRKRPGKKRRIAARTREREAKRKAEAADKSKMTKEEHLREKKKRLNRLRKLKRRAKAKDGKGGDAADAADDADSSDGSGN